MPRACWLAFDSTRSLIRRGKSGEGGEDYFAARRNFDIEIMDGEIDNSIEERTESRKNLTVKKVTDIVSRIKL